MAIFHGILLNKGGRQSWLPGGCPSIERTGKVGTEIPPTGLKALPLLQGGIRAIFIRGSELEKVIGHCLEDPGLSGLVRSSFDSWALYPLKKRHAQTVFVKSQP
jgi:hypothetical protein